MHIDYIGINKCEHIRYKIHLGLINIPYIITYTIICIYVCSLKLKLAFALLCFSCLCWNFLLTSQLPTEGEKSFLHLCSVSVFFNFYF